MRASEINLTRPTRRQMRKPSGNKGRPNSKARVLKGLGFFASLMLLAVFMAWPKGNQYKLYSISSEIRGSSLSVSITDFSKIEKIPGYEMQDGFVYFMLKYTFKNISHAELLDTDAYPYVCVSELVKSDGKLVLNKLNRTDEEMYFDLNALKAYGLRNGIGFKGFRASLAEGEEREDIDIIKIPEADLERKDLYITIADLNAAIALKSIVSSAW